MVRSTPALQQQIEIRISERNTPPQRHLAAGHVLHHARRLQGSPNTGPLCLAHLSQRHRQLPYAVFMRCCCDTLLTLSLCLSLFYIYLYLSRSLFYAKPSPTPIPFSFLLASTFFFLGSLPFNSRYLENIFLFLEFFSFTWQWLDAYFRWYSWKNSFLRIYESLG